jgi:hypothetical protein
VASHKYDFDEDDKVKILLWCARHCCLCGKFTGIGVEVAHLDPNSSDLDNAIPLCFDCHAAIGHYNRRHPRGRKYSIKELKARRDQVYEQHTRHLVPPVYYKLIQGAREFPDVGFEISNLGNTYPIRARVNVALAQGSRSFDPITSGHYNGKYLWNLNPGFIVNGHFKVPSGNFKNSEERLRAKIDVTLIDIYNREHTLLPVGYIHRLGPHDDWYFEPSVEELAIIKENPPE